MKSLKYIVLGVATALTLLYAMVSAPVMKSNASGTVYVASSAPNHDISVLWGGDSYDASQGKYTATFKLHNNRSYGITVSGKWLQNFCVSGSASPCLQHQSVVNQSIWVPANSTVNATLSRGTYNFLNYHVVNVACGTFQYDYFFTTYRDHFGTTDLHTTWAAAWYNTRRDCVSGYPTPTPTRGVTPTPTQGVTPTPTTEITPTQGVTPTPTQGVTPTPTTEITPTQGVTPTPTNNNNCDNEQDNNGGDANNNCNNNNNNQEQHQEQNNNQTVNITVTGGQQQQQVLSASNVSNLPSTGTPIQDLLFLGSLFPAGIFLRKRS
jgi:hypothetical protein